MSKDLLSSRAHRDPSGSLPCGRRAKRLATRLALAAFGRSRKLKVQRRVHKKNRRKPASFSISCASLTWWLLRGGCTRSHSEHGRETPLRQWYFVSRRGRVGRCQVCKTQQYLLFKTTHNAGWSSPVARQAHNLKAAGSNPAPATNETCNRFQSASSSARMARKRAWKSIFSFWLLNAPALTRRA